MAFDYTNFLEVDATVEADFNFTARDGTLETPGSGLYVRNSVGKWCLETTGSTPSGSTGPTANPPGRSAYVYTEASSPILSTSWAMKRNTSFNASTDAVFLDLKYNLYILATSEFYIEYATVASPNETTDWTILETIVGTNTNLWIDDTFDFSAITSATLWIRIRFSSSSDFRNDLAFSTWREYGLTRVAIEQEGFRFRNDDGSESTATWKAGQDSNITPDQSEAFRLRVLGDATGVIEGFQRTVQYKRTDESADEWRTIG